MASRYTAEEIRKMTPAKRREAAREKMLASDQAGMTEGPRSPIPVPRPSKGKGKGNGRALKTIMSSKPSQKREEGRRKLTPATGTSSKPKPKSTRHVHASTTTPSRSSPPPKKGRQSGMYSSKASGGRGSAGKEAATRKKKAAQVKRSKAWLKRYGGTDRNDR